MPKPKSLAGRVALVTGGAGGIGKATAVRLLREGACVVLADIDETALAAANDELGAVFGKDFVRPVNINVTKEEQVISGFATLRYKGSSGSTSEPSKPFVNYGGRNTTASVTKLEPKFIHPYPAVTIPQTADQMVNLTLGRVGSSYTWTAAGGVRAFPRAPERRTPPPARRRTSRST